MRNCFHLALLAAALLIQSTAVLGDAPVVYVDASATGANDGTSWADAYTDLQQALSPENTAAPAQLWVAAGVYKPVVPENFWSPTTAEREESFKLRSGIAIYGGFSGVETALEQRDWEANRSVLSGDITDTSITDAQGIVQHPDNLSGGNSFNVVYADNDMDANARLDGVVITGGWADYSGSGNQRRINGGGVYSDNGQLVFHNMLIIGNKARYSGGGVYNPSGGRLKFENTAVRFNEAGGNGGGLYTAGSGSSIELRHSEVSGNQSGSNGGGLYSTDSTLELSHVKVSGNQGVNGGGLYSTDSILELSHVEVSGNQSGGWGGGGGLYSTGSNLELSHVAITENLARYGGGIYANSRVDLENVDISRNRASGPGGGIVFNGVEMNLMNVTLLGNQSGGDGGAVYFNSSSGQMQFDNALLAWNWAQLSGGGIYRLSNDSTMALRNVAIVSNRASRSGGGIWNTNSYVHIYNSIIYANLQGGQLDSPGASLTGSPIVWHSLIQNHSPDGPGNFDCVETCPDPMFEYLPDGIFPPPYSFGNFRLRWGSPAIDAGDNARVIMEFDLDGAPRIQNGRVDLGPYESTGPLFHDRFEQH